MTGCRRVWGTSGITACDAMRRASRKCQPEDEGVGVSTHGPQSRNITFYGMCYYFCSESTCVVDVAKVSCS